MPTYRESDLDSGDRKKISIDFGWRFFEGERDDAQVSVYDDSQWQIVDLPHDWSILGNYDLQNPTGPQGAYLPAGIGWYRKKLDVKPQDGIRWYIKFDGVYMNADVWINGHHLGQHVYGYTGFEYDLTPFLSDADNCIAVRVDNSKVPSARWYTGSGIYRHVWLTKTGTTHVSESGTYITTKNISSSSCEVQVKTYIDNARETPVTVQVVTTIMSPHHEISATEECTLTIGQGTYYHEVPQLFTLNTPELWSPEFPRLYKCITKLFDEQGIHMDTYETFFGIRRTEFDPETGFSLNGQRMKLKGVCLHEDAGPVGTAVPEEVLYRRLLTLKKMGCNSIRTAHHPMRPEFYDMCDYLGLMVIDEIFDGWNKPKARHDFGLYFSKLWKNEIIHTIRRHRNHPSVILWSVGNEVLGKTDEMTRTIQDLVHEVEPTRQVTCGRGEEGIFDVQGYNGNGGVPGVLEEVHAQNPQLCILLTEEPHTFQTRGFYRTQTWWRDRDRPRYEIPNLTDEEIFYDGSLVYNSSYDNAGVRNSARNSWRRTRDMPFIIGEFRWTGIDYLGESFGWPGRMGNFGVIDLCGFAKDTYYFYQSQWTTQPMVHILPHWTHPGKELVPIPVWVYSNCDFVELIVNGVSLGEQKLTQETMYVSWTVPYTAGRILAIGKRDGQPLVRSEIRTASEPYCVKLSNESVSLAEVTKHVFQVRFEVQDVHGNHVPTADHRVFFYLLGPGHLLGLENGDPIDLQSHHECSRRVFNGLGLGIFGALNPNENIELFASAILAESIFTDSTNVNISVTSISLQGTQSNHEIIVRYTLDGSLPTLTSTVYNSSFSISESLTIKAAVWIDGIRCIDMESFIEKGRREKIIDLTHGNGVTANVRCPEEARDPQLVGEWICGNQTIILANEGEVLRKSAYGDSLESVGVWCYVRPKDPFEDEEFFGNGSIVWSDGKETRIELVSHDADCFRVIYADQEMFFRRLE